MDIMELVHEDRSAASRPFSCSAIGCLKAFARRSDLVRHMRIHSNERPWICDWSDCSRDFIQRSALTVHYRVHTGERPHRCEYGECDKAFSDSSSLARHRRIHTGKRPYKCPEIACGKTFCRKTTLTKHIKRNHPDSSAFSHGIYSTGPYGAPARGFHAHARQARRARHLIDDRDYSGTSSSPATPPSVYNEEGYDDEYEYDEGRSDTKDGTHYYPLPLPPLPDLPDAQQPDDGHDGHDDPSAAAMRKPDWVAGTSARGHAAQTPIFVAPSGSLGPNAIRQHLERQERKQRIQDPRSAYQTPPPQHPRHMREPSYEHVDGPPMYTYDESNHQQKPQQHHHLQQQRHHHLETPGRPAYPHSYPMTPAASVYSVQSSGSPQISYPQSHPLEASWSAPLPSSEFVGAQHYTIMHMSSSQQPNYYSASPLTSHAPSPFKAHRRRASSVGALDGPYPMVALPTHHTHSTASLVGLGLGISTSSNEYTTSMDEQGSPYRRFTEVNGGGAGAVVAHHSDLETQFPTGSPEFSHYHPHQHQPHGGSRQGSMSMGIGYSSFVGQHIDRLDEQLQHHPAEAAAYI